MAVENLLNHVQQYSNWNFEVSIKMPDARSHLETYRASPAPKMHRVVRERG